MSTMTVRIHEDTHLHDLDEERSGSSTWIPPAGTSRQAGVPAS